MSVARTADLNVLKNGHAKPESPESLRKSDEATHMVALSEKVAKAKQAPLTPPTNSPLHKALKKGLFKFATGERSHEATAYAYVHKDGRAVLITVGADAVENWATRYPDGHTVIGISTNALNIALAVTNAKHKFRLERAEKRIAADNAKARALAEKQLEAAKDSDVGYVASPVTQALPGGPPDHVLKALQMLDAITAHRFDLDLLRGDKHYSDRVALVNVLFNRGRGSLQTKTTETGITKVTEAFYSAVGTGEGKSIAARSKAFAERSSELLKAYRAALALRRKEEKRAATLSKAHARMRGEGYAPGQIIPPDPPKSKKQRAVEDAATRAEFKQRLALTATAEQPAVPKPDAEFLVVAEEVMLLEDPQNGLAMMQLEKSNSQGAICVYNNGSRVAAGVVPPETLRKLRTLSNVDLIMAANQFLNPIVPSVSVTSVAARYLTAVIHCKELQPMTPETTTAKKFAAPAKAGSKATKATPKASKKAIATGKQKSSGQHGIADETAIKVLDKNPAYREGSKSANSFALFTGCKTAADYRAACAKSKKDIYEPTHFMRWASTPHGKQPAYIKLG